MKPDDQRTCNRDKKVRPSVIIAIAPGSEIAVVLDGTSKDVRYAAKGTSVVVIQPVDSISGDEHVDESVVIVVSPNGALRITRCQGDNVASIAPRHFGEGAVSVVPEELVLGGNPRHVGARNK